MKNVPDNVSRRDRMLSLLRETPNISMLELAQRFVVDIKTIKRDIGQLKQKGLLRRIGPDKGGYWEVVADEPENGL